MFIVQWYSAGGKCGDSAVAVCSGETGDKVLETQYISKSLPAPDEYPVRVFINITYSFMDCPNGRECDDVIELQAANYSDDRGKLPYTTHGILPDHRINDTIATSTQHFYFDLPQTVDGFFIALVSSPMGACVMVSRVLVYRYECPGEELLSTGLARRPATQAPISGGVSVTPYCVENSHQSQFSNPERLECRSTGHWLNDQTHCICDEGFERNTNICIGKMVS